MDLAEFVKATLVQIIDGVRQAQAVAAEHGAVIGPIEYGMRKNTTASDDRSVQTVEFDVAVAALRIAFPNDVLCHELHPRRRLTGRLRCRHQVCLHRYLR